MFNLKDLVRNYDRGLPEEKKKYLRILENFCIKKTHKQILEHAKFVEFTDTDYEILEEMLKEIS